jgi:hypothetical protein
MRAEKQVSLLMHNFVGKWECGNYSWGEKKKKKKVEEK